MYLAHNGLSQSSRLQPMVSCLNNVCIFSAACSLVNVFGVVVAPGFTSSAEEGRVTEGLGVLGSGNNASDCFFDSGSVLNMEITPLKVLNPCVL